MQQGAFKDEIVPVRIPQPKGDPLVADTDEFPRPGVTAESLAALKPAFKKDGRVTAGNSSGINDGAAFVLLASEDKARVMGREPLAWVTAWASAALEPARMGFGPVPATAKALAKAGWKLGDISLIELNEAFASQSLAVIRGFAAQIGPIDQDRMNANGGAIALGHPIGASGARVLTTLIYALKQRGLKRGIASLCLGGAEAVAMAVEIEE